QRHVRRFEASTSVNQGLGDLNRVLIGRPLRLFDKSAKSHRQRSRTRDVFRFERSSALHEEFRCGFESAPSRHMQGGLTALPWRIRALGPDIEAQIQHETKAGWVAGARNIHQK